MPIRFEADTPEDFDPATKKTANPEEEKAGKPAKRKRGAMQVEKADAPTVYTVSELMRHIRLKLEAGYRNILLEGEISNCNSSPHGHLYFGLKDENAQIRCVMFRGQQMKLKFVPEDGLEVVARGTVGMYEARGDCQLNVTSLEPKGVGALQLAFEQLKAKLSSEGLFEAEHKKPLPRLPRAIGMVTSQTGSVLHDMMNVLNRRFKGIQVYLAPASVQGDQAPRELIRAFQSLVKQAEEKQIDVIIIGRGGGSMEDLWAFNHEELARTLFASPIPVISAVGHETDFTIADFVSDVRAPTPSAAMELAVPNRADLLATLGAWQTRNLLALRKYTDECANRLERSAVRLQSPEYAVRHYQMKTDELEQRLRSLMNYQLSERKHQIQRREDQLPHLSPIHKVRRQRNRLEAMQQTVRNLIKQRLEQAVHRYQQQTGLLASLSPFKVLTRGYAVVTNDKGQLVGSSEQVQNEQEIHIRLKEGGLKATVKEKISPGVKLYQ